MDPKQIVQLIVLLDTLLARGPTLLASLRATLSEKDEQTLQAELARLRAQNDADYASVREALDRIAKS